MGNYDFTEIVKRYLEGNATDEEKALLFRFYDNYKKNDPGVDLTDEQRQLMLKTFRSSPRFTQEGKPVVHRSFRQAFLRRYGRAAAIVLPLALGASLLWKFGRTKETYKTVITGRKEVKQITLPDSSQVILNALSKLDYREDFTNHREIYIDGQACFKVVHDAAHPFIVKTSNGLYTQDLGTEFVVSSYNKQSDIRISVISGSVRVGNKDSVFGDLVRGQEIRYDRETGNIGKREETDVSRFLSWNKGEWYYPNMSFSDLKTLMDIDYNIYVENATGRAAGKDTTGSDLNFSKRQNADQIINIFTITAGCHYKWISSDTVRLY